MRLIRAQLKDVLAVHRLYMAYHEDLGKKLNSDEVFQRWIGELCNEKKYYILLSHGRKNLGLVWGEALEDLFSIEGIFLKRAWRGKYRFTKWIYRALLDNKKKFGRLKVRIPEGCTGINVAKFKPEARIYSY